MSGLWQWLTTGARGDGDEITTICPTQHWLVFAPRWWQVWRWLEWYRTPQRYRYTMTVTGNGRRVEQHRVFEIPRNEARARIGHGMDGEG